MTKPKRKMHPNSLANLVPIQKQKNKNHGCYKLAKNAIKEIPEDSREQFYKILWLAISMRDVKTASEYLKMKAEELPEYGFVLQLCIRELMGKRGFQALMEIADRIWGKPVQATTIEHKGEPFNIVVKSEKERRELEDMKDLSV